MKTGKLFNGNYATIFLVILILFILTGCGTAAGADSSAEPDGLEAYLNVQNSVPAGSGEPIMVYWLLENHTQEALYLLKWYTPLEGIAGEIFEVTRDGQPIPYLGPLVSRGAPTPEAYIFLEPDKGVTAEVNIAQAYDFSQPGTYSIKFRSPRISHLARSEAEMATSLDELGPVNIPSKEVTLEVVGSSSSLAKRWAVRASLRWWSATSIKMANLN